VARKTDALNKLLEARTRLSVLMASMDGQVDAQALRGSAQPAAAPT
jgi:predicted component of type VI protein secretion system